MTNEQPPSGLSPDDQRIVDAIVDAGFNADAIEAPSPDDQRRADAVTSLFELLGDYPVEDADNTLVHATLARVDRCEHDRSARMTFGDAAADGPRRRLRLPDFISVAAVVLIGASVVWPLSTHMRQRSIDLGCESNLRTVGLAFGSYSSAWNGAMPTVRTGLFQAWTPGAKNAVNLNPLLEGGYCNASHLQCPGHDGYGDSYSYQFQTAGRQPHWGVSATTIVLGDRNPLIDAARTQSVIATLSASINHGGRGQFVLSTDGSTAWLVLPVIGTRDNIWLPGQVTFLRQGDKLTDPAGDVFLAH